MTKRIALAASAAMLALTMTPATAQDAPTPKWMTRPCKWEDSVNCYWDASTAGNGKGHSFYAICGNGTTAIVYTNRKYNRRHMAIIPGGC